MSGGRSPAHWKTWRGTINVSSKPCVGASRTEGSREGINLYSLQTNQAANLVPFPRLLCCRWKRVPALLLLAEAATKPRASRPIRPLDDGTGIAADMLYLYGHWHRMSTKYQVIEGRCH